MFLKLSFASTAQMLLGWRCQSFFGKGLSSVVGRVDCELCRVSNRGQVAWFGRAKFCSGDDLFGRAQSAYYFCDISPVDPCCCFDTERDDNECTYECCNTS